MWRAAFDKNRPSGAEQSWEPSLILAGERLNDTSCLNLRTWCQADANLLAGDVLLRRPCSSPRSPFQFTCTFIVVATHHTALKWLFWLTVQVCVWLKKMSQVSLVAAYINNKRCVSELREWMKYVLNCSSLWEWLSSLPDSQHPLWPFRHHRWYPGTGQPPVRESERSTPWLLVQPWILPHRV